MNAIDWGIAACVALLLAANVGPWLVAKIGAPAADSDRKPAAETAEYIASIVSVPATAEQHVAALTRGDSVAEFMRSLLAPRGGK